jgi:serine/threonine-protein kinase RsbW
MVAVIRLRVPATLRYRDLAVRAVAAACKLVGDGRRDRSFDDQVVSAFGESFNNVTLHAYDGLAQGDVEIQIDVSYEGITVRLLDHGNPFDPAGVPEPDLDALPESGLGLYIMKQFMDEVSYQAGKPNVLHMHKRLAGGKR